MFDERLEGKGEPLERSAEKQTSSCSALLSCPFCGGTACRIDLHEVLNPGSTVPAIQCNQCNTIALSEEIWNSRTVKKEQTNDDYPFQQTMILCQKCGNKRCPHATDRKLECTNSNEPGQPGSAYR